MTAIDGKGQKGAHDIIIDHEPFDQGFKPPPAPNYPTPPRDTSNVLLWEGREGGVRYDGLKSRPVVRIFISLLLQGHTSEE